MRYAIPQNVLNKIVQYSKPFIFDSTHMSSSVYVGMVDTVR